MLNASDGTGFVVDVTENTTSIVFENLGNAADAAIQARLWFRQGASAKTVALSSSWIWPGGTTVSVGAANMATLYELVTLDGGTSFYVRHATVDGAGSAPDAANADNGDLAYGIQWYGNAFAASSGDAQDQHS